MKLIDILVEELPKRDGWPAKASHAVYAKRFSRVCFTVGGAPAMTGDDVSIFENDGAGRGVFWLPGIMLNCVEPVDYATAIITREQYEAALAAKNEGWIEWGGGKHPPVSTNTVVDVKFKNGNVQSGYSAGEYSWEHAWQSSNIIAYRLHQPQEEAQSKSDEEAELNECIGQDASPAWTGEGLPPVGCVCERSWAGDKWLQCEIIFTGNEIVLVKLETREAAYRLSDVRFRPIRSEAERKRDAAVEAIDRYMPEFIPDTPNDYYNAKKIYDAIAAGKIPGVKLDD